MDCDLGPCRLSTDHFTFSAQQPDKTASSPGGVVWTLLVVRTPKEDFPEKW